MAERVAALEAAAQLLMSPPFAVPEQERKAAELTFVEFKKKAAPYAECKNILDSSSVPYLKFIALSTMKDALLREWSTLPKQLPHDLLVYLVHFVQGSTEGSMSYITREAVHLIAVIVKRQMSEGKQALQDTLTTAHALLQGNPQQQHLALVLLSAVLTEFGSASGPGQKGLTVDFLVMCKREIEGREMVEVFTIVLQILRYFATLDTSSAQVNQGILSSALELAGLVLDWDYSHRLSTAKGFTSRELYLVPFRPPAVWASTLLQPDVVQLFFKVALRLHDDEALFGRCIQCLSQLASLTGVVMATTKDARQSYLERYLLHLIEYLSRPNLTSSELCGITSITRRLLDTFPPSTVALVEEGTLNQFCSTVSAVSIAACRKVAEAQTLDAVGDAEETLDSILGIWARLVSVQGLNLHPHLAVVLEAFLKSKLAAPEGWRDVSSEEEEVTAVEIAEGDLSSHSDQLLAVSLLSLEIPSLVVPLLIRLVGSRVVKLTQFCTLATSSSRSQAPPPLDPSLLTLYEDLHWLALIAGHILANPSPGEANLVPGALMELSANTQSCPLPASLLLVVKMEVPHLVESAESYQQTMSSVDLLVALPAALLQCSHVYAVMATAGLAEMLSPQLAETLSWFESLWAKTYLHINEKDYNQVSMSLLAAISPDSVGFSSLLLYLLDKACVQLGCWSGEESLCLNLCGLLRTLLRHPACWSVAGHSQPFVALLQHCVEHTGPIPNLTPDCQRALLNSLVMATAGKTDSEVYITLVRGCLSKLALLLSSPLLPEDAQLRGALCYRLEALCGVLEGVQPSQVEDTFNALHSILSSLSELLRRLAGFGEAILLALDVFRVLAEQFLPHLAEAQSCQLFELCLSLLSNYTTTHSSKYQSGSVTEEQQCEDLVICLRMLKNLTTKDFIDFAETSENLSELSGQVVLEGLRTILPLVSESLLQYPMFCSAFYDLISHVCEVYPEVVLTLEDGFFSTLTGLVEVGLTRFGSDIGKQCLESIESLACHCLHQVGSMQVPRIATSLQHFIKALFLLVLSATLDSDLTVPLSAAVFTLLCLLGKDVYQSVVVQLVQENDPSLREKLLKAFQELVPSEFELIRSRLHQQKFSKNFQTFLTALESFMYVL